MGKYLIALQCGGLMEQPEIFYGEPQVIKASSKRKAIKIYNKNNDCSFFYGECIAMKFLWLKIPFTCGFPQLWLKLLDGYKL